MKPHILCSCLVLCAVARAAPAVAPSITSASPNLIDAGGSYFPMTINGTGFLSGSVAYWGPTRLSTAFVSAAQLTAEITPDLRLLSGKFSLTVANPDGMVSSAYPITVAPGLSTVAPAGALMGSPPVTITATGFGFTASDVLVLNAGGKQAVLATTRINSGTLTAVIPANALTVASAATLQVLDPVDGNSSGMLPFDIRAFPAISSALPAAIDAGGPYFVMTVTGTGFTSASILNWSASPVVTTFLSSTKLQASITPELRSVSGTFNLTVTDSGAASAAYPIVISPVLFALSPPAATALGPAVTITATGLGFNRGNTLVLVARGQQSPLVTTYVSSTTLTAAIPQGGLRAAGSAAIQVVDSAGTGHSLPQPFTISPPVPTISGLIPAAATVGAATFFMTVNGVNFAPGVSVLWNGSPLSTAFQSSTQLTASVPANLIQTVGTAAITTSNSGGAVSNSLSFAIYPPPPTISMLQPTSATAASSLFILIVTGTNCTGSVVQWNGSPLDTTVLSATQVTASVPSYLIAGVGTATIRLVNRNGAASSPVQFTIYPAAPTITSLSPNAATQGVATFTLTVSGINFVPGSTVLWNGLPLSTTFVSATQVTAFVPASLSSMALSAAVTVASPGGAVANSLFFTIDPPRPAISVLFPDSATAGGASFTIIVTGMNFAIGSVLRWNGLPLTTTFVNPTQLTAVVPANLVAAAGAATVTIINPSGLNSAMATFTITPPAPVITSLAPASTPAGGPAFTLAIAGAGFVPGATVLWNTLPLTTAVLGASQLTAVVPASLIAATGTVTIGVALPGAISNLLTLAVTLPLPATTGIVNPASLLPSIAPGSLISILGTNLAAADATATTMPLPNALNGTAVTINGIPAPLVFVSATLINAQAPFETNLGTATLIVQAGNVTSIPVTFEVTATAPGVLTAPGSDHVMAQNNPGGELNSPDSPARPGQYVTVYLTGQGVVDNPVPTGAPSPASPISTPLAPIQVRVGGKEALITFAGLAPGLVGLLQLDIVVPDVLAGEQPFDVTVGGVSANTTMLSVKIDADQ